MTQFRCRGNFPFSLRRRNMAFWRQCPSKVENVASIAAKRKFCSLTLRDTRKNGAGNQHPSSRTISSYSWPFHYGGSFKGATLALHCLYGLCAASFRRKVMPSPSAPTARQPLPLCRARRYLQIVLAFYSVKANVGASFSGHSSPSSSAISSAEASLNAVLSLSIICLAVCFTGLFAGYTLMFDR